MKRWIKQLKQNNGFSLVEAIVSVVILGIAIVPISMVFTQSVDKTIDTRVQLYGTKIAQYYMENLKNLSTEELVEMLPAGTKIYDSTTDMTTSPNLDSVPDGYRVVLSYETEVDLVDYALPSAKPMVEVDAIVHIDSGFDAAVDIHSGDYSGTIVSTPTLTVSQSRRILIEARRSTHEARISYIDDATPSNDNGSMANISLNENAIRFVMGSGMGSNLYTTVIEVDSDLEEALTIYIYEDEDNTVSATTEITSGICSFSRNLYEVSSSEHRILETRVDVYNDNTNELIATLTSTAINE